MECVNVFLLLDCTEYQTAISRKSFIAVHFNYLTHGSYHSWKLWFQLSNVTWHSVLERCISSAQAELVEQGRCMDTIQEVKFCEIGCRKVFIWYRISYSLLHTQGQKMLFSPCRSSNSGTAVMQFLICWAFENSDY